jgi:hypothetical protein
MQKRTARGILPRACSISVRGGLNSRARGQDVRGAAAAREAALTLLEELGDAIHAGEIRCRTLPEERFNPTRRKRLRVRVRIRFRVAREVRVQRLLKFFATDASAFIEIELAEDAAVVLEVAREDFAVAIVVAVVVMEIKMITIMIMGVVDADNDIALLQYTGGTTGVPKGAMLTHDNLFSNARMLKDYWGWVPGDVLIHALPIFPHTEVAGEKERQGCLPPFSSLRCGKLRRRSGSPPVRRTREVPKRANAPTTRSISSKVSQFFGSW